MIRLLLATAFAITVACSTAQDGIPADDPDASAAANADAMPAPPVDGAPPDAPAVTQSRMQIAASGHHSCAVLSGGMVRCWGMSHVGQLGYGSTEYVGDDELPASMGDVDVGGTVAQIAAGDVHTCALLDTGAVRCWGTGWYGRLGYGSTDDIGDDEAPATAGDVDVGGTVVQLSAGYHHTCALLDTGSVRCWGYGRYGSLGYGNTDNIGDDETPADAGDVDLGWSAEQIAAGYWHTCALLTGGHVRCWGWGAYGMLGNGGTDDIGDDENVAFQPLVDLGGTAVALAAGYYHTCALLDTGDVRCWGRGGNGRLGYGNTDNIGDDETPASAGDVDVGGTVIALAAGLEHSCALLDTGGVRCWGRGLNGRLGYGNTVTIGDDESPASAGDVELALGGDDIVEQVLQLDAGHSHTCAQLQNTIRCWGRADAGQLGYGNTDDIGDDETPAAAGAVPVL